MAKTVIREVIIELLVCLAVLLILSVVLYNYIPANKVVPEEVEYKPSAEIKAQLNSEVEDNSNDIIMTYEVTAQDLDNYVKTNEYNPGKANPFAPYSEPVPGEGTGENVGGGTGETGSPINGSQNGNSGGSLFENGTSK